MTGRPANPLTDQLLAGIHQVTHQSPYTPEEQTLAALLADKCTTGLPGHDPGAIGELLLHLGPLLGGLVAYLTKGGRAPGAAYTVAMRVANLAGAELYIENRAPFNDAATPVEPDSAPRAADDIRPNGA